MKRNRKCLIILCLCYLIICILPVVITLGLRTFDKDDDEIDDPFIPPYKVIDEEPAKNVETEISEDGTSPAVCQSNQVIVDGKCKCKPYYISDPKDYCIKQECAYD